MDIAADLVVIVVVLVGGVAQGAVMKFDWMTALRVPIDGGRRFRGRPVFGPNKTWRGVVVMTVSMAVAGWMLFPLAPPVENPPVDSWAVLGALLGAAYIAAELPNSFVKRRLGIEPGDEGPRGWSLQRLMDLSDSVLGVVAVLLVLGITAVDAVVLLVLGVGVHAVFDALLHRVGAKSRLTRSTTPTARRP